LLKAPLLVATSGDGEVVAARELKHGAKATISYVTHLMNPKDGILYLTVTVLRLKLSNTLQTDSPPQVRHFK
jgi:hypothetical protein